VFTYAPYYPAILLATLIGGTSAECLAMVLAAIVEQWAFEPPYFAFGPLSARHEVYLLLYAVAAISIIWTAGKYRRVIQLLDEQEHYRQLVADELGHRTKNNFATVCAILNYELRGNNPEISEKVMGRLRALAAADRFVTKSDGHGACIADILINESMPYDESRVRVEGEPILLPPNVAVTLALIFHELATNAAKYGALSRPNGRITVSWTKSENGKEIAINWRETGGPPAVAPSQNGFGRRLLERGLDPFNGRIQTQFTPDGFGCTIMFELPPEQNHWLAPRTPARVTYPHASRGVVCEKVMAGKGADLSSATK